MIELLRPFPFPLDRELRAQLRSHLAQRIAQDAYRTGHFVLTSGETSDYYIDGKQVTLAPAVAPAALLILDILHQEEVEAVGGMSIGADPIAGAVAALSFFTPRPLKAFIVRKEAKGHGTGRRVEGPPLAAGTPVAIVEDVITKGGSSLEAIRAVEAEGARVVRVITLVDRLQGGRQTLEAAGYPVTPLFDIQEIRAWTGRRA